MLMSEPCDIFGLSVQRELVIGTEALLGQLRPQADQAVILCGIFLIVKFSTLME